MEDIISQGDDRPPASRRRRLAIAVVLVAVAVLVIVEHLPSGTHHAAAPKPPAPPKLNSGDRPITVPAGDTARWAASDPVPRAGHHPDWFWPGRGRTEPIKGLPYQRAGYVFTRLPGGWALTGEGGGTSNCGNCPASPPPRVFFLADRARLVAAIGKATMVAPGAGRVGGQPTMWLTTFPGQATFGSVAATTREYTASGRQLGRSVVLPVGYTVIQGTARGLLLASVTQLSAMGTYQLWNPVGGKLVRTFSGVIAASASEVALRAPCLVTCPVQVVNLLTGTQSLIKVEFGEVATEGAFSPDGRYLALQTSFGEGGNSRSFGAQLEVASMATTRLTVVPHTAVFSDELSGFGWPVSGDSLVAEFSFAARSQMAIWNPARARLAVAGIRHDQNPTELVVG